jgi:hypothetical protein
VGNDTAIARIEDLQISEGAADIDPDPYRLGGGIHRSGSNCMCRHLMLALWNVGVRFASEAG